MSFISYGCQFHVIVLHCLLCNHDTYLECSECNISSKLVQSSFIFVKLESTYVLHGVPLDVKREVCTILVEGWKYKHLKLLDSSPKMRLVMWTSCRPRRGHYCGFLICPSTYPLLNPSYTVRTKTWVSITIDIELPLSEHVNDWVHRQSSRF